MRISNIGSAQIEIFAALAESRGFSEAAQRLGLTQSAVSHGLARLETELGTVLVERGKRGVVLTPAGRAVLPQAREVLVRLQAVRQAAESAGGAASGKLRFGVSPLLLPPAMLSGIVSRFRQEYPGVELSLMDGAGREIEVWLGEGLVEVGTVTAPQAGGIEVRALLEHELCLVVPEGHPLGTRSTVEVTEIADEALLIPRFGRELFGMFLQRRPEADASDSGRPPLRHQISDLPTLLDLVRIGMGIGLVTRAALPARIPGLQVLSFTPPLPVKTGLGAARSWDSATPVARLFAECAEAWARENGFLG